MRDYEKVLAYWPRRQERESKRRMDRVRTEKVPKYLLCEDSESCDQDRILQIQIQAADPTEGNKPPVSDHDLQRLDEFLRTS